MSKRHVRGIPLLDKQPDDCPRGGEHEDLPFVQELDVGDGSGDKLVVFYCLKCHCLHWQIFPKPRATVPIVEPTTHDDNPILDGIVHA